jgi:3-methyladenine DNA glycosylase AlkD
MSTKEKIIKRLKDLGDEKIATQSQSFFKTGKGEYGEGDHFLGIRVPVIRKLVQENQGISLDDILKILRSSYHEARLFATLSMVLRYKSAKEESEHKRIYEAYLANTDFINNWDIVDASAEHIVGAYLFERSRKPLFKLVNSQSLWERRISIISTFYFIRKEDFSDTLAISEILIDDKEDLIHKAVGWMLREVGKRNYRAEEKFLLMHYKLMPRTMLRYAIERFPEKERKAFLKGEK